MVAKDLYFNMGLYLLLITREMGGSVGSAPARYGSSLCSNRDIAQKDKMGDISKEVSNTLSPAEKINKTKNFTHFFALAFLIFKISITGAGINVCEIADHTTL